MPRARKDEEWNYISGEKGANRVRVFVHRTGKLFAEYRRDGRKIRYSMGHTDRGMAKVEADNLAATLRQPDRPEPILIGQLFDNYLREVTPTKALSTQKHDRTTIERFRLFLGPERRADSLTHRDAAAYEYERRRGGDLRPRAKTAKKMHYPMRSRSIVYDLRKLKAVLTWGVHAGVLDRNMLTGYKVADDGTPHRPIFTEPQYRALLKAAGAFPWQFGCLLVIAHETGHRLNAMLTLQWRDIDLTIGRITWRRENDKIGYEHVTPVTDGARAAIEDAQRRAPGIGGVPVLPGLSDRATPISTSLARDWIQRAQVVAGFELEKGRGWHAFRRNFASELRHVGLRDLCDLGGWKDPMTVVKCYQRPSEDAMRAAQASRRVLDG